MCVSCIFLSVFYVCFMHVFSCASYAFHVYFMCVLSMMCVLCGFKYDICSVATICRGSDFAKMQVLCGYTFYQNAGNMRVRSIQNAGI